MTRDRQAAIDRAVAAYRRLIRVNARHTVAEMIADLIEWHKLYVDKSADIAALLEMATRRAEVAEAGRESMSRNEIPPEEMPPDMPEDRTTLDRILRQDQQQDMGGQTTPWDAYQNQAPPFITFDEAQEARVNDEADVEF